MTTLELQPRVEPVQNPYFLDYDSSVTQELLKDVVTSYIPYADGISNPDLGTKRIYMLNGDQHGSDLGRVIEANVLKEDPKWGQSPEETSSDLAPLEANSRFFILVDMTENGPELAGSLRIADCGKGTSETESFIKKTQGDIELPEVLQMKDGREGVWDVVYIAVRSEYQNGINSAWLYHALYKNSVEEGVREWTSNISRDEHKRLKMMGIPFARIVEIDEVEVPSKINPEEVQHFGFYHTNLDIVGDSVDATARKYETRSGSAAFVGKIALISRFGSETRPVVESKLPIAS